MKRLHKLSYAYIYYLTKNTFSRIKEIDREHIFFR